MALFSAMPRQSLRWLLAEMVVVILGILIAFQVEEYQTTLEEREEEARSLRAILGNLEVGDQEFVLWETALRQNHDYFESLVGHISGRATKSQAELEARINQGLTGRAWAPTAPAFTGMRDSGKLSLISDQELEAALVSYFDITEPYLLERRIGLRVRNDEFIDALYQDLEFAPSEDFEQAGAFIMTLAVPVADFPTHPEFMRHLRTAFLNNKQMWESIIPEARASNSDLRRQIQDHLITIQ